MARGPTHRGLWDLHRINRETATDWFSKRREQDGIRSSEQRRRPVKGAGEGLDLDAPGAGGQRDLDGWGGPWVGWRRCKAQEQRGGGSEGLLEMWTGPGLSMRAMPMRMLIPSTPDPSLST